MKTYYAKKAGFIDGTYREIGQEVGQFNDVQAKYLVIAELITAKKPKKSAAKKSASKPEKAPSTKGL